MAEIFGSYPCCDGFLALSMPEKIPAYFAEDCPHCGARVWHRLSKATPRSWTEADFLADHSIDPETMTITKSPNEAARLAAEEAEVAAQLGIAWP